MNEVSVSQQLARRDRHFLHAGNNPERANAAQAPAPLGEIYGLTHFPFPVFTWASQTAFGFRPWSFLFSQGIGV